MKAGWEVKTLGEVCEKTKTIDPRKSPDTPFTYVDVSSVSNQTYRIENTQTLRGSDAPSRARKLILAGDILFATIRPTLQRIAQVPIELDGQVCSTGYAVIRPKDRLDARFLMYSLFRDEFGKAMEMLQSGASYPAVTERQVWSQLLPVPPLEEQKQIVAILDEAFEGLDRDRANVEANLEDSKKLLTAFVDSIFSRNCESWISGSISEMVGAVRTGPFGSLLHKSDYVRGGRPLINPANIVDGVIIPDASKSVDAKALDRLSAYLLEENDIIIGRRGEMGRCALVSKEQSGSVCGTGCFFIRPKDNVAPAFISQLIRSPSFVKALEEQATGATMLNLSNKSLGQMQISLPTFDIQADLLKTVQKLESHTTDAAKRYKLKLTDLADLRQSLLQKAFAGELTLGE